MEVDVVVVPDCASTAAALDAVRAAALQAGIADARVTLTVIGSDAEADARGFVGSPSFLVDGSDLFPAPGSPVGMACRLYRTSAGLRGLPEVGQLQDALVKHRHPAGSSWPRSSRHAGRDLV